MAEVEMVPYKDFLICPTPVRTQVAPKSTDYRWRAGFYIYSPEKDMVKNLPGLPGFPSKDAARQSAITEGQKIIDAGL